MKNSDAARIRELFSEIETLSKKGKTIGTKIRELKKLRDLTRQALDCIDVNLYK